MKTLGEIELHPNERLAIEAAARLLRENLPVSQVILFGSKARGDGDAESDIDLLSLTSRPLDWREEKSVLALLAPIQEEFDVFFGTIEISEQDWYHGIYQVMPLRTEVERDGVIA